jgi:hypothetical protein
LRQDYARRFAHRLQECAAFSEAGRRTQQQLIHVSTEVNKEIELEIAHVLFLDIVGYSKLSVNEQHARVDELNRIVRLSERYQKAEAANRILKIPTGDGMALVFYRSPEEPAQCARSTSPTASRRNY